jgi:hypothetical protein
MHGLLSAAFELLRPGMMDLLLREGYWYGLGGLIVN